MTSERDERARYIMIGGFLGAGKTTAVSRLARRLSDSGVKVGLITNDQSSGLVDTAILRSHGYAVEEIAGGCFCCRFSSLSDAAERLTRDARPDVFLAEPVGSCTDLVATVSYPLRRIYGERFTIAPLSVLVDPKRAMRILGLAQGRSFSEKVVYVYEKQLEEAELIVVNKCDQLDESDRTALVARLGERFPRARVLSCSALEGDGLDAWFDRILVDEGGDAPSMSLDYRTYAEGEALLGWMNLTAALRAPEAFDANALLLELAGDLRAALAARELEVAHLKMTLDSEDAGGQLAALSLTANDGPLDMRESLIDGVRAGELIVNLRAEADPEELLRRTEDALARAAARRAGLELTIQHREHFRPAPPQPTHRMTQPEEVVR